MSERNGHYFRWVGGDHYQCEKCGLVEIVDALPDVDPCEPASDSDEPRRLTVLEAHSAADCPDRRTCWAAEIHDEYAKAPVTAMTDPRIDAGTDALILNWNIRSYGIQPTQRDAAREDVETVLTAADAAASAAGWVRINLNDDEMLDRLSQAIDIPSSWLASLGITYDDIPRPPEGLGEEWWRQIRERAIRAALSASSEVAP